MSDVASTARGLHDATRRASLGALASGAAGLAWPGAVIASAHRVRHERFEVFGSPAQVAVVVRGGEPAGDLRAAAALREVREGFAHMHTRWHAWKPGALAALNAALREGRPWHTPPDLLSLIDGARRAELASGGLFNAAIGGLVGAWGFHDDELRPGHAPSNDELARWLGPARGRPAPSLASIEIRANWVRSDDHRVQLDFGGYAKGVAIDWALGRLRARGFADALVELGGDLATQGRATAAPWRIGIRHPASARLLASLTMRTQEAVVTSGIYERWRLLDGRARGHILDPRDGLPADALVGVTVVHPLAAWADAAATALLVAGPTRWRALAKQMGLHHVLAIDSSMRTQATAPLAARLDLHALGPRELDVVG